MAETQQSAPRLGILRLPEERPIPALIRRILLAIGLIVLMSVVLWFDRDGLRDNTNPGRPLHFLDVFYFTVVSLTTVGYGDIVPATSGARLINAVVMTPIRIFLWAVFLGTAYEVTMIRLRLREERRMSEIHHRLRDHVIVCGYGVKGQAIVDELRANEEAVSHIVVIDESEAAIAAAAKRGCVALRGDATTEALLNAAEIGKAGWILVAPNRDDAATLICLTARSLAPNVRIIAAARDEENVKLLYRAGADLVIAPSVAGGRLMATAVRREAIPQFMEDMLSSENGLSLEEMLITPAMAGSTVAALFSGREGLVIGLLRAGKRYNFGELRDFPVQAGDAIVYLADQSEETRAT